MVERQGMYEVSVDNGVDAVLVDEPTPLFQKIHHPLKSLEKTDSTISLYSQKSQNSDVASAVEKAKTAIYNSPIKKTNSVVDKLINELQSTQNSPKRRVPETPPKNVSPKKKEIAARRGSSSAEEELMELYRQQQQALKQPKKKVEERKGAKGEKKELKGKKEGEEKKKKTRQGESQTTRMRTDEYRSDARNKRSKTCTLL